MLRETLSRIDEYERFLETLPEDAHQPTFDEWFEGIYRPAIEASHMDIEPVPLTERKKPKWLTDAGKRAVRKRPVTTVLGTLLTGLTAGGVLGAKSELIGGLALNVLALFGL